MSVICPIDFTIDPQLANLGFGDQTIKSKIKGEFWNRISKIKTIRFIEIHCNLVELLIRSHSLDIQNMIK